MEGVGRAEDPFLEGCTSLGFLAGQTTSITLAMLVTGVTYRYPGLLAKTLTTLDVLSQGPEPEVLKHKIDVLTHHCETVGRDVTEIRKTVGLFADPFADVDGYLKTLDQYAELGIEMINIGPVPGTPDPVSWVKGFGDDLMPRLAGIG